MYSVIEKFLKRIGLIYLLICIILYFFQNHIILQPTHLSQASVVLLLNKATEITTDFFGIWVTHKNKKKSKGLVVLFHGNGGQAEHRLFFADSLHRVGLDLIIVEYAGYGQKAGNKSMTAIKQQALHEFEQILTKIENRPIYLIGESFGAGIASEIIKQYPSKINGVVFITPWYSLPSLITHKLKIIPGFLAEEQFNIVNNLQSYSGTITILAAGKDVVIPVQQAKKLHASLKSSQYLEVPNAGHVDWMVDLTLNWKAWFNLPP